MKDDDGKAREALKAMAEEAEELGLYNAGPTVCVSHLRFVPCRKHADTRPCSFSSSKEDVDRVAHYQLEEFRGQRNRFRDANGIVE